MGWQLTYFWYFVFREHEFHFKTAKIAPIPTKATLGHASGGKQVLVKQKEQSSKPKQWKMNRFDGVQSRVSTVRD